MARRSRGGTTLRRPSALTRPASLFDLSVPLRALCSSVCSVQMHLNLGAILRVLLIDTSRDGVLRNPLNDNTARNSVPYSWLAAPLAGRFFPAEESAPQAGRLIRSALRD